MSSLKKEAQIIFEKNQLIFRRLMLINFVTLLGIFSVTGVVLYSYLSRIEKREVVRVFNSVKGAVLEGVFSYETLGSAHEVYRDIGKERLEAAYKINNVAAQVRILPCGLGSDSYQSVFKLKIGSEPLKNCVYVKNESRILSTLIFSLLVAFLFALALPIIFWRFYKRRLYEKILLPILRDLERQRVEAAMGELAQHIAHDIRSPLAALELVANTNVNVSRDDSSKLIKQSIIRIREIANGILDKSKLLQSGAYLQSGPLVAVKSDIKELVTNVVDEVKLVMSEKGSLTFKTEIKESVQVKNIPLWNGLHRVLTNLVTNAAESTHFKNGIVEIKTLQKNDSLFIRIKDNGEGIDSIIFHHIGKKGWTSKKNGNGLGIYKAKEFAKQYGGDISYQSIPGQGTECLIELPFRVLEET